MVVLNRIYTRTGDDGSTALGNGERRKKYDLRIAAYGTLDEVNALIGLVRLHAGADLDGVLGHIQNDLFDVEAELCLSEKGPGGARLTDDGCAGGGAGTGDRPAQCRTCAAANRLSFRAAARRRVSAFGAHRLPPRRTTDGRAQRQAPRKASGRRRSNTSIGLSDFFFVASRYANEKGERDVLWSPGQNR